MSFYTLTDQTALGEIKSRMIFVHMEKLKYNLQNNKQTKTSL